MTVFIGIDPGLTGALACIDQDGRILGVYDTPILTVTKNKGTRRELDRSRMVQIIGNIIRNLNDETVKVAIERVNSMPGQGVASSFTFGMGYGVWLGIVAAFKLPVDLVHPVRWKKVMLDGMGKDKDASRIRAQEMFAPYVDLNLKKHHGRADALLIAEWRRRQG